VLTSRNLGGAGGVDVQVDGLLGVLVLQVEELGEHELRDRRHQPHPQVHDPILVQERGQIRRRLLPRRPPHERHNLCRNGTVHVPFSTPVKSETRVLLRTYHGNNVSGATATIASGVRVGIQEPRLGSNDRARSSSEADVGGWWGLEGGGRGEEGTGKDVEGDARSGQGGGCLHGESAPRRGASSAEEAHRTADKPPQLGFGLAVADSFT
jgi:hypothetical protein